MKQVEAKMPLVLQKLDKEMWKKIKRGKVPLKSDEIEKYCTNWKLEVDKLSYLKARLN